MLLKKPWERAYFLNCETFHDVNNAFSNFFQNKMVIIHHIFSYKPKWINNPQKWFDGEALRKLSSRDKHFKNSREDDSKTTKVWRTHIKNYKKAGIFE